MRRSRPGGAQPYAPEMISASVPHTPTASVSTSTGPSASGGSSTSSRRAEPAWSGITVSAFISSTSVFFLGPRRRPGKMGRSRQPCEAHGLFGFGMPAQVERGVYERHVREGLGKVPHLALGNGVVFLGQKPQVVSKPEQAAEQRHGVVVAPEQMETVRQPERTGQKGAFAPFEPVDGVRIGGPVAKDESVLGQVTLDGFDGGLDPLVGGRQEAHERDHEQAGIQARPSRSTA